MIPAGQNVVPSTAIVVVIAPTIAGKLTGCVANIRLDVCLDDGSMAFDRKYEMRYASVPVSLFFAHIWSAIETPKPKEVKKNQLTAQNSAPNLCSENSLLNRNNCR